MKQEAALDMGEICTFHFDPMTQEKCRSVLGSLSELIYLHYFIYSPTQGVLPGTCNNYLKYLGTLKLTETGYRPCVRTEDSMKGQIILILKLILLTIAQP
jgi:hypothetical protein